MKSALYALLIAAGSTSLASAQCDIIVRESFRTGPRPHGGNGRGRIAEIHDPLKDYWTQIPQGLMWRTNDQSGLNRWAFAGSSTDPSELDPLDPQNGTAFGEETGVALLPIAALLPNQPVTFSCDLSMLGITAVGFTSSPALNSNFATGGALWMTLHGDTGNWVVYANGSNVVASGTAPIIGVMDSGWLRVELTYNPITSTVKGFAFETPIPETPVTLTMPMTYFGMEAIQSWGVMNNLSVTKGTPLAITQDNTDAAHFACTGGSVTFTAHSNADPSKPFVYGWRRAYAAPSISPIPDTLMALVQDGPQPDGSIISGATTDTLTISNLNPACTASYRCEVATDCGLRITDLRNVFVDPADIGKQGGLFGYDGLLDNNDFVAFIELFFARDGRADMGKQGGLLGVDHLWDNNDFVVFVDRFFTGCPH